MMKRIKTILLVMILSLGVIPTVLAQARNLTVLEMRQIQEKIEAKVEPKENAEVGKIYESGDILLIVEGGNEKWHAVAYKGNVYYVKKSETVNAKAPVIVVDEIKSEGEEPGKSVEKDTIRKEVEMDETFMEELEAELEVGTHEGKAFIESYTAFQEETKQKKTWGLVIGGLMVAIFGVSIYARITLKKDEELED